MSTPIVPIMDNLYLETFFFFVPNRLLWKNWEHMLGAQDDPDDSIDFITPVASYTDIENQSLLDYFGIPTGVENAIEFSSLPVRAYCLIWNEWFRDENLQNSVKISKDDSGIIVSGSSLPTGFKAFDKEGSCFPRGKRHDYFTSCTISPQKFEALSVPIGGRAAVKAGDNSVINADYYALYQPQLRFGVSNDVYYQRLGTYFYDQTGMYNDVGSVPEPAGATVPVSDFQKAGALTGGVAGSPSGTAAFSISNTSGLYADLSQATATSINDLRTAFQIQRLLESQNRSGTRIKEILLGQFGVLSPDSRLQLPEYLGGSSKRININPVMQTSSTDSTTPQGNLAAYGVCADRFNGFVKSFTEHGWIIGLVNVRADLTYQQGLNRMWSRKTRYDYYWPTLAHLGEQAVLNKEIYTQGTDDDEGVFGYQERWSEYRYYPNMITGKFRSTDSQSLDIWHLAQKFDSLPQLNYEFIQDDPPVDRVVAVPSEPQFFLDVYFKQNSVRPMPVYSIPGLIDHF